MEPLDGGAAPHDVLVGSDKALGSVGNKVNEAASAILDTVSQDPGIYDKYRAHLTPSTPSIPSILASVFHDSSVKKAAKKHAQTTLQHCVLLLNTLYEGASCIYLIATLAFAVFISCMFVEIFRSEVWPILKYVVDIFSFLKGPIQDLFNFLAILWCYIQKFGGWIMNLMEKALKAILPKSIADALIDFMKTVELIIDMMVKMVFVIEKATIFLLTSGKQVFAMLFAIVGFAAMYFAYMVASSLISPIFPFTADVGWVGVPALAAGIAMFILRAAVSKQINCCGENSYTGPFAKQVREAYSVASTENDSVFWAWALICVMALVGFVAWVIRTSFIMT